MTNPETGQITLIPRADEIEVTFLDWAELNQNGAPKKRKAMLSDIIKNIQQIHSGFDYQSAAIKSVDMREYALKTIDSVDKILDKFAKVDGHYQKERENDEKLKKVAAAFAHWLEDHPDTELPEQQKWLTRFATNSGVDLKSLAVLVGIDIS